MKNNIITILLIALIIWGYIEPLVITNKKLNNPDTFLGIELDYTRNTVVTENLTFVDGLKNGAILLGRILGNYFKSSFEDYISGFDGKNILSGLAWGIFGILIVLIKNMFLSLIVFLVYFFSLITIKGHITYYIGYLLSILLIIGIIRLYDNEDSNEINNNPKNSV